MWRRFDSFAYWAAQLSAALFLYAALTYIGDGVNESTQKALLYLGAAALWGNVATTLTYYRRRLKQLAPEEMSAFHQEGTSARTARVRPTVVRQVCRCSWFGPGGLHPVRGRIREDAAARSGKMKTTSFIIAKWRS